MMRVEPAKSALDLPAGRNHHPVDIDFRRLPCDRVPREKAAPRPAGAGLFAPWVPDSATEEDAMIDQDCTSDTGTSGDAVTLSPEEPRAVVP